jgi:hypothetical protein
MSIQKNVARTIPFGSVTTGGDANTATVPTVTLIGDGGTPGASTNAAVHKSGGSWQVALTQAEMNFNTIALVITGTGLSPLYMTIFTEADYTPTRATYLDIISADTVTITTGSIVSATSSSITLPTGTVVYPGESIYIDSGPGIGQSRVIDTFTPGPPAVAGLPTGRNWDVIPTTGTFKIFPGDAKSPVTTTGGGGGGGGTSAPPYVSSGIIIGSPTQTSMTVNLGTAATSAVQLIGQEFYLTTGNLAFAGRQISGCTLISPTQAALTFASPGFPMSPSNGDMCIIRS